MLIEIKGDNLNTIKESMKLLKDYKGRFAIQSFNPLILYWLRKKYNSSSTINTKLMPLQKVVNHCYEDGVVDFKVKSLFQNKTLSKQYAVKKENNSEIITLTRENIVSLLYKEFKSPYTNMSRDMWIFSFFMVGINMVDIFHLKKDK